MILFAWSPVLGINKIREKKNQTSTLWKSASNKTSFVDCKMKNNIKTLQPFPRKYVAGFHNNLTPVLVKPTLASLLPHLRSHVDIWTLFKNSWHWEVFLTPVSHQKFTMPQTSFSDPEEFGRFLCKKLGLHSKHGFSKAKSKMNDYLKI